MSYTTFTRHLAFPTAAKAYNYNHEVIIDDIKPEHLRVLFQPDERDDYVLEHTDYDSWMVVAINSSNDGEHVDYLVTYQRERLLSGLYPSVPAHERYMVVECDDGARWESIGIDQWP